MHRDKSKRTKKLPRYSYYCKDCRAWHLTSSKMKRWAKINTKDMQQKEHRDKANARGANNGILRIKNFTSKKL